MIPPSGQEHSHGKTQYIPGKQDLAVLGPGEVMTVENFKKGGELETLVTLNLLTIVKVSLGTTNTFPGQLLLSKS